MLMLANFVTRFIFINEDACEKAISDFISVSISKRGSVRSLCYENQFSFILKSELTIITKILN